jgi:vacuolar-type H+-ATPase subunit I/STV1
MASFEEQMRRLNWEIQDKEREIKKLKDQLTQLQIDYEEDIQNYNDRWGMYSNGY